MLESVNGLFHLPRMNYDFWRTPVSGCFTKYHFRERGTWSQGHGFDILLLYEAAKDRDVVSISIGPVAGERCRERRLSESMQ